MRNPLDSRRAASRAALVGAAVICLAVAVGCDVDPSQLFGRRVVAGDYYLTNVETWYLLEDRKADRQTGCGVIEGHIKQLGWNDNWIIAWRKSCIGESDGWMIVDVQKKEVAGPVSDDELARRIELRKLERVDPRTAWKRLPWRLGV